MKKQLIFLSLILISFSQVVFSGGLGSMCRDGEEKIFSCTMKNKKTAVVCVGEYGDETYMQYRYGKPSEIELEFPSSRDGSLSQFSLSRYFRPDRGNGDGIRAENLVFTNDGVTYDLGEVAEGKGINKYSIIVTSKDLKSTVLNCVAGMMNIPLELEEIIPCDTNAGVNNASCAN